MIESLQPGAHLTTPRAGYEHHGLYAGGGRVLHYGGYSRPGRGAPVEEVTLAEFTRGRGFTVCSGESARFSGPQAVARARSRLGENRYSLLTNNCEHFVTWSRTGIARSRQVEIWQDRLALARAAMARALGWAMPDGSRRPVAFTRNGAV
ncbi:MAG: lecithin retinol acyltransferase family protein [Burkholderiaceae bacterium]|jgi:HRAS-like suppressor 3